tara:strand:- start:63 stop:455 length:393 start_codon:yes stop_codon:yes gene_type:complete
MTKVTEHDIIMQLFNDYGSLIPNDQLKAGMSKEIVRRLRFNGFLEDADDSKTVSAVLDTEEGMIVETAEETTQVLDPADFDAIPADTIAAVNKVRRDGPAPTEAKTVTKTSSKKAKKVTTKKGKPNWIGE